MQGGIQLSTFIIAAALTGLGCQSANSAPPAGNSSYDQNANGDYNAEGAYTAYDMDWPEAPQATSEKFEEVGTNPFVVVNHDPFSTFAADVDTASYDIFRRDIEDGRLPDPASVRLEEFVNYFAYDYPAPTSDAEHPFAITVDAAPNIMDRNTTILRVGIQAVKPPPFEKKPANIVFLIDVSGSMMDQDKLPLVRKVLTQTLSVLDPTDTVSIVTYASDTGVRLEATPVSQSSEITAVIDSLSSGGSTAGGAGIKLAYEQAESVFLEEGINQVILCTDGDFNVGVSSDEQLVSLIEEKRDSGITLTVLGFGYGNLNDSMMEKVSNAGNGIYSVISSESHAERYVENRMLANIEHVAKDMKIQVEFNPEQVYAYRLLGYENRAIADDDFRDDSVDAGEIGAGHRVTALYELVMTEADLPKIDNAPPIDDGDRTTGDREISASDMVLVKVRYKTPDASESDEAAEVSEGLSREEIAQDFSELGEDYEWVVSIAAFAEILKESPYADNSTLSVIREVVHSATWLDPDRSEFTSLFDSAEALIE